MNEWAFGVSPEFLNAMKSYFNWAYIASALAWTSPLTGGKRQIHESAKLHCFLCSALVWNDQYPGKRWWTNHGCFSKNPGRVMSLPRFGHIECNCTLIIKGASNGPNEPLASWIHHKSAVPIDRIFFLLITNPSGNNVSSTLVFCAVGEWYELDRLRSKLKRSLEIGNREVDCPLHESTSDYIQITQF